MKHFLPLLALSVSVAFSFTGFAAGLIIVENPALWPVPPPHPPFPPRPVPPPRVYPFAPLEITEHKVSARVTDQFATTTIEQSFYNPNPQRLEGTFLFPVPKGAQLSRFTLEIDGKKVEAELLAADKARGIYEDIVRRMKDPALLEYAGRDVFKVRVFPIEPRASRRVTLSYAQLLRADAGLVAYTLPLNTDKFSAKPLRTVSVKVELESQRPLKAIYSPSHSVEVRRNGRHKATIGYEANHVKPDTDLQIFYSFDAGDIGANLLAYRPGSTEDGYFLLIASPGVDVKDKKKIVNKDVTFVLDTSGSMAGKKLEQAKKAMLFCVENLNDGDRFEVLRFSTDVEPVFNGLVGTTKENRARATDFIRDLKPIGSTAIDDALRQALALRPKEGDRPYVVIFLTDGRPTIGVTQEEQIVANVRQAAAGTRVFCFGIGTDVNTHLLDKITEETKAYSQYVLPEEDIETKVSAFFTKIKEPVLANVKIHFPASLRVTKLYPAPLPDLFRGEQLVLAGRYAPHARAIERTQKGDERKLIIEGTVNGEKKTFTYEVNFPDETKEHDFIPRLWATRRVGYLLDEIRLRGENAELKDEVTELARRYGIVTPYTAYLIVEDEARRGVAANHRSLRELERDEAAVRQSAVMFENFRKEKSGNLAVAGAQFSDSFKNADRANELSKLSAESAVRSYSGVTVTDNGGGRGSGGNLYFGGALTPAPASPAATPAIRARADATQRLADLTQQNQFIAGKNFFQNGAQWVDAEAQKLTNSKPVRVQFGSKDYFALQVKHPEAAPWLALGSQVQFTLKGALYEIHE